MPLAQCDSRFSFLALKSHSINRKRINKNGNNNNNISVGYMHPTHTRIYFPSTLPSRPKSTISFHICFLAEVAKWNAMNIYSVN